MNRKSSRRDFLKGKAAVDALDAGRDPWSAGSIDEPYLIRISRRAMACEFEVILNAGQHGAGTEAALEALDLVEALEAQMTVFRATSEISRLNREAAQGPAEVEPRLFDLLELALELHAETGGAFDVTAGPLWKAWGFARRAGSIPGDEELRGAMANVGSHLVELDAEAQTVRFRQPGVELNLGSLGKGYALDRCLEVLTTAGIDDFLLHGGQSSVLARGSRASATESAPDAEPFGWVVGIAHPRRRATRLAELRLRDRALATSGSGTQFFRHKGRRYGHVLDPRTGQPAEGLLSATVVAPTAARADALSTALFVMGPHEALQFCQDRPELGAVLVCPTQRGPGFEIRSTGLEENELRILSTE